MAGTILFFRRKGFRHPLVLFSSEAEVTGERALRQLKRYFRRWRIEQLFREEKQLFALEGFKVTAVKAITRYLHLVMLAHTLLFLKHLQAAAVPLLRQYIEFYLKKKRKQLTLCSLKLFYEKCRPFRFDFTKVFALFLQEKAGAGNDFLGMSGHRRLTYGDFRYIVVIIRKHICWSRTIAILTVLNVEQPSKS